MEIAGMSDEINNEHLEKEVLKIFDAIGVKVGCNDMSQAPQ